MKEVNKKRPGFTLVEMVVVISILGILSSIGLTKFADIQEKAKLNADCVTSQNIIQAYELAYQQGAITDEEDDEKIQKLVSQNYLSIVPEPQSVKEGKFILNVGSGATYVSIDGQEWRYPEKPDIDKES